MGLFGIFKKKIKQADITTTVPKLKRLKNKREQSFTLFSIRIPLKLARRVKKAVAESVTPISRNRWIRKRMEEGLKKK